MRATLRSSWALLVVCLLLLTGQSAFAQRSIRVDIGDGNFSFNGQSWGPSHVDDLRGDLFVNGAMPFQLNFGSGATQYDFSFSENGFVSFVAPGSNAGSVVPPAANYVAPYAADFVDRFDLFDSNFPDFSVVAYWGTGRLDTGPGPYGDDPSVAPLAIRFTWSGMCPAADPTCASALPSSFQTVLINRGNGDFDLELNGDRPSPVTAGGFALGGNLLGSIDATTPDFCFRAGRGIRCDDAVGVPSVPEPASVLLMALGLLALLGIWARRPG